MSSIDVDSLYLENSPDAIVVVDEGGVIGLVNPRTEEMFGYEPGQLIGQAVEILIPEDASSSHRAHRTRYRAEPTTRLMGDPRSELSGRRRDGSTFPVEISLSPLHSDSGLRVMACVRDITERRAEERRSRADREALRIADDRERIARDLHDVVIQRLFGAGMRLQAALSDPDLLVERGDETISELDEIIVVIRRTIFALTDSGDSLPTKRIQRLADSHGDRTGVAVDLRLTGDIDGIRGTVLSGLEASLTEALSNVARHAAAQNVRVAVTAAEDVALVVTDDGVGILEARSDGLGLPNIEARAEELGGRFSVSPGPDGGTRFAWRVPAHPSSDRVA